jgi:DNA-binding SARP family transcriptional activator
MTQQAEVRLTGTGEASRSPRRRGNGRGSPRNAAAGTAMRIRLCGILVVDVDGEDGAAGLPGRRGRLLLAYLVANRDRAVRRDELIEAVWGAHLPSAPQASLSSLLTAVRRALGPDALSGRSVLTLTLPPDVWIDVEAARASATEAEAALAAGHPSEALQHAHATLGLTTDPVLTEFQNEWVEHLRADVGQLRCDQLETATRAALALGGPELATAERFAGLLVELEPYRESGYALLMEALASAGNVAEALRTYDELRVRLRDELGVSPAPGLTALHQRLLLSGEAGQARVAVLPRSPALPELPLPGTVARSERHSFVAREAELERLRERWAVARRGQGQFALLTGEPGIGKTRLAARFAADAHARGAAMSYGRADEDSVVPYQPFVEALRHLVAHVDTADIERALGPQLAELRPLLPELVRATGATAAAAGAENQRYVLFEAVCALLDHIARLRPLILIVEDLHWADTPTLLLLRQVVRHAETSPMLVLATYRDVELGPGAPLARLLVDLRRELVVHRIALGGLDERGTSALVAARAEEAVEAVYAARLREYTAGNPFFIEETLRSIDAGRLEEPSRHDGTMWVPESVQDVILLRFERLAPPTQELLTCAAVLGRDFSLVALERVLSRPAELVLAGLEEAANAGLVVEHPERVGDFSFCHALVRETVYARPAASRRALLHLRAAEALSAARGTVEVHAAELAYHFFLARHTGGAERAVTHCVDAGRAAAGVLAYEEAASHYEQALEALDLVANGDDAVRMGILLELGAVRWQGGEAGARLAFDDAAVLARRRGDRDALVRAALGAGGRFYAPGHGDRAYVALLEEALGAVTDRALRARVLARLAQALASSGGERPATLSAEALSLARGANDRSALAAALLSRHAALLHISHLDERLSIAEEAVSLADREELREFAALARHWLIHDLLEAGNRDEASQRHAQLEALASELQQPLYRHSALAWRGVWAQLAGGFDEAERLAREGLRLAERAGAREAHAHFAAQLLVVRREQGRMPELLPAIERLAAEDSQVLAWRAVLPLAYLEASDDGEAAKAFAAAVADDYAAVPDGLFWLPATAWLAEAASRLGDAPAAAELLARLEPYAGRLVQAGFTGCWGAVDGFLGIAAVACGRRAEGERHLWEARSRHLALDAAPLIARTRRDLARATDGGAR